MSATINGITYDELSGSPSFSGGRDGPKAQRRFKVAWTDADRFLGIYFPAHIQTGKGWIFPVSQVFPGKTWMSAESYKLEPWDPEMTTGYTSDGVRSYNHAKITIEFNVPEYDPSDDGKDPAQEGDQILADYSSAYSAEMLKLGVSGWMWNGPDKAGTRYGPIKNEEASVVKVVGQIEHTLAWNYVPSPPFRTISQSVGCVNSDEKLFYAPAQTLLFTGAEIKRSYHSQTGAEAWKVNYKFVQRCVRGYANTYGTPEFVDIGWNHFWRNEVGYWDAPFTGSVSNMQFVYREAKFANLFKSDGSGDT